MNKILESILSQEPSPFDKVEKELKETLSVIAQENKAYDQKFIREKQEYFDRMYDWEKVRQVFPEDPIIKLYDSLQKLLKIYKTPKKIKRYAEETLKTYLIPPQDCQYLENLNELIEDDIELPIDRDDAWIKNRIYGHIDMIERKKEDKIEIEREEQERIELEKEEQDDAKIGIELQDDAEIERDEM